VPFTDKWINANGGLWNVGSNWSTGLVPGSADEVLVSVPAGSTVSIASPAGPVTGISLDGGGTLSVDLSGGPLREFFKLSKSDRKLSQKLSFSRQTPSTYY
jgi:hypothetical protein